MSNVMEAMTRLRHPDRIYIGGEWVAPTSDATIEVIDSGTEAPLLRVAEAKAADMTRAIEAARHAFDHGPWPRMTPEERAHYVRAIGLGLSDRRDDLCQIWPRQSGVLHSIAQMVIPNIWQLWEDYAALAIDYPFEQVVQPTRGGRFGLRVREPVGVVGAIVAWNGPIGLITHKLAPALIAGCTVILKPSPEAPGEAYIVAEVADAMGLPPGVLNVLTAEREVSQLLVEDSRVDKITFTGSTAAGRQIGAICGGRIGRFTLELGGKSAAVILDDVDLLQTAKSLAQAECMMTGQVCSSLTRIVVSRDRHDEFVDALAGEFSRVRVGDPFDANSQMGPLAMRRQRDRVEGYIAKGVEEGASLVTGGRRPEYLDRGFYIEPTVFANVDNSSTIAREEIFGPVLSVIPARDEEHAIEIANDTIFGLNASVFTNDVDRARAVARRLRSGTVGHNAMRTDFGIAFGGFKQSGVGREGGSEGLSSFLETKAIILDDVPSDYASTEAVG